MANNNEDIKWLYDKLSAKGYDIGSQQEFTSSLANEDDRDWYYDKAVGMGLDVGSKDDFNALFAPVPTPAPQPQQEQPTQPQSAPQPPAPAKETAAPQQTAQLTVSTRDPKSEERARESSRPDFRNMAAAEAHAIAAMETAQKIKEDEKRRNEELKAQRAAFTDYMEAQRKKNEEGRRKADMEREAGIEWDDPEYRRELDSIEYTQAADLSHSTPQDTESASLTDKEKHRKVRYAMSDDELKSATTPGYGGRKIRVFDLDKEDKTPYEARARIMKNPEDIYRVIGKVDRMYTEAEPGQLPEFTVEGVSGGKAAARLDEYLRYNPDEREALENDTTGAKRRELTSRMRAEMNAEIKAVDNEFEQWKTDNPHKVSKMTEEDLAMKREEIGLEREFMRKVGNIDKERDYIYRRYHERIEELKQELSKPDSSGKRLSGAAFYQALDYAMQGDDEIRLLNAQIYNLGQTAERYEEWVADGKQGTFTNYMGGIKGALKNILINPLGLTELMSSTAPLMHIRSKLKEDGSTSDLSQDEVLALEDYFLNKESMQRHKMSLARSSGEFTGAMLEIAAEFGLNPASGVARRTLAKIVAEVGKDGAMSLIRKSSKLARLVGYKGVDVGGLQVARNLGKVTFAALGEGTAMSLTTQGAKNVNQAVGRMTEKRDENGRLTGVEKESGVKAGVKTVLGSAATNTAFVFPVTFGAKALEGFNNVARSLHVPFGNPVDAFVKMKTGEALSILSADATGRSELDPTWREFADANANGELIMGLLASELTIGALKGAGNQVKGATLRHNRAKARTALIKSAARGAKVFAEDNGNGNRLHDWEVIVKAVYEGDEATIIEALQRAAADKDMTGDQKEAVLDYARAAYRYIGAERGYESWRTRGERERAAREAEDEWNVKDPADELMEEAAYDEAYESVRSQVDAGENTGAAGSGHSTSAAGSGHSTQAVGSESSTRDSEVTSDAPSPVAPGRDVAARVREAEERFEDAFGDEADYWRVAVDEDGINVSGWEGLSEDQREAAVELINAQASLRGALDAMEDHAEDRKKVIAREIEKRTHKDSGLIVPATMKEDGRSVHIVKGDVRMLEDGSGVDVARSKEANHSRAIFILDGNGEYKSVSVDQILSVGETIDPQTELQTEYEAIDREQDAIISEATEGASESVESTRAADTDKKDSNSDDLMLDLDAARQMIEEINAQQEAGELSPDENVDNVTSSESDMQSGNAANVSDIAENANISTENRELVTESAPNFDISVENGQQTKAGGTSPNYLREYTHKRSGKTIKVRPDISDPDKDGVVKIKFVGEVYDKEGNLITNEATSQHIFIAPEDIYKTEGLEGLDIYNEDGSFSATELRIAPSGEIAAYDKDGVKIWLNRNPITGKDGKLPPFEKEVSTALSRIPVDEKTGQPVFEAVDAETAWDGLVEDSLDEAEAEEYATGMTELIEKEVEKARKKVANVKVTGDRKKFKDDKAAARAELEGAEKRLAHWSEMLSVRGRRAAEAEAARRAEASRLEAERRAQAERERAEREEAERIAIEVQNGVPDWRKDTAEAARARGFRMVDGERVDRQEEADMSVPEGREASQVRVKFDNKNQVDGVMTVIGASERGRGTSNDSGAGIDVKPVGRGKFGDIFAAFRGKAKAAWQYLSALKSGQARGVFYRPEIGEIDLVWGEAPTPYSGKGLAHIDRKHVKTLGDFASMEEAIGVIDDVVRNGEFTEQDAKTAVFDKGDYRVVVARDESGNWVLTAFDNKTPAKEKKKRKKDAATRGTAGQPDEGARAVAPNPSSAGKGNALPSDKQGKGAESSLGERISAAGQDVDLSPTEAQKRAGNYRKGHVQVGTFDVTIENPAGSKRSGTDPDGKKWETTMTHAYGYIRGTEGVDGERRAAVQNNLPEKKEVTTIDPRTMSDEEKARRGDMLRNAPAINIAVGQIVATKELSARKAAEKWWDENVSEPAFYDTEVGEVEINKNSVESSLAHKYGQMKLDAITSLIDGFENAVYLGTMPDFIRQEGVSNHFFAYPINYNGKRCYVFCRAMQDANKNRLYVHEVFVSDKIKKGDTLQTAASQPHGGIALYRDILANVLEASTESEPQQPNNAVSSDSSLPAGEQSGKSSAEPNGKSTASGSKGNALPSDKQAEAKESSLGERISAAGQDVDLSPTEAQKRAGNYRKGHVQVGTFDVTIENPAGSKRSGTDPDGKKWETTMTHAYGYIRGTEGVDGDHIDVYLSSDIDGWNGRKVFVVDQYNPDESFDEHKVMLGFNDKDEAMDAYLSNYEDGWEKGRRLECTEVTLEDFERWIDSSKCKTKAFADYKSVKAITEDVDQTRTNINKDGIVTDGEGKPLTLYHGTPNKEVTSVSKLEPGHKRMGLEAPARYNGNGVSFSPEMSVAQDYATEAGLGKGRIYPANIRLTNPYYTLGVAHFTPEEAAEFTESLKAKGHDGIINYASKAIREIGALPNEVIVFDNSAILPIEDNDLDGLDYTITPTEYQGKKKKTPVWVVKFDRDLSDEEKRALVAYVNEPLTEGKKTSRGWLDKKSGQFYMRSEDAAKGLAGILDNPEAVADAQPLTAEDYREASGLYETGEDTGAAGSGHSTSAAGSGHSTPTAGPGHSTPAAGPGHSTQAAGLSHETQERPNGKKSAKLKKPTKPEKAPANRVDVEGLFNDLSTKGETKLSDHAEPVKSESAPEKESGPKRMVVDDEMRGMEDELRSLLGIDDSEGDRGDLFRDPEEFSNKERMQITSLGITYALKYFDQGIVSFPDFADRMVRRMGEKIRPWLKAFYGGARDIPGYDHLPFTPADEVKAFDVMNFDKDKKVTDPIMTAAAVVAEVKAEAAVREGQREIVEERNRKRKENDKQREADTEAIGEKADTVAGKAESLAKASEDETDLNQVSDEIDETIDEINDQLALLGYYEADLDSPEHEVFGLRRSAEKKAVKDAVKLAKQLVDDLGIELDKVAGKTTEQMQKSRGKNDTAVRANIAQVGGDITVNLPYPDGRNLHINIGLSPTHERGVEPNRGGGAWEGDNYEVDRIMFRFGDGHNHFLPTDVTYGKMLDEIQRAAKWGQPKKQEIAHAGAPTAEDLPSHAKEEESHNGYKRGDEVMWDRYGNGKWEKVTIEDFDADGSPIFESVKGIMSEKGDWSRVKPSDGVFGEAKRVVTQYEADQKKSSTGGPKTPRGASGHGEGKKQPAKKKKEIKPEQPVGDLFGGLFDNEPETLKENGKRNGNKPSQGLAGGELTHSVGADEAGTDGRVPTGGTGPTGKGGAADAKGSGVERGTEGSPHGTDAYGELQPRLGDRGRNEGDADSGSAGAGVERGGATGEGSGSRRGAERGGEGLSEGESSTVAGRGSGSPAVKKARKPEVRYTRNFRYDEKEGNEADTYTPSQRLEANVKAIETLAEVLFGDKPATEEQRAVMSRFRGWGQVDLGKYYDIDHILRNTYSSTPINRLAKAIQKLDPQGDKKLFDAIKRASLSSYYTPTPIARAMNTFLSLAGFKGGALLDPSMGNGMYEGTLPKSIQERTAITGVELDWLSGQLSRQLYPDANVMIGGFEKSRIAPGSFDVVTSNVPFGDIVVNDPTWKNDATPLKRSAQNRIHNYYAVKMLEAARPGGLVGMLTTSAVMDTPSNQNIRAHIADQGEILGAIRLPDNTFQGTGVVTDMILIRKWRDDQDRVKTREDAAYKELEQAFLSHYETTAPNKLDGKKEKVQLNGYFEKNPRNLIGEIQAGNQYGKRDAFGLTSKLSVDEIASEIEKAIKRIVGNRRGSLFNPTRTIREVQQAVCEAYKGNGDWISNGNLVIQDGKVGVLTAKSNEYGEVTRTFESTLKHDKMLPRIKSMIDVRTAMKKLIAGQIEGSKESILKAQRSELQKAYDNFVGKYGRLQDKDNSFILDDIDGYTLQALERWKNGKFEGLSDIFTKNSIKPALKLDGKKTPQEAVALSLAEYGYLRPDYLAKALGEDWEDQCGDFVFLKPNSVDAYITRDEYLSGDVVTKLAEARAAAEKDKALERNVKALEEVQPERIPFDDIAIHLGARWIPESILNDFVNDLFGIQAVRSNRNGRWDPEKREYVYNQKSGVRYIPETDSFEINIEKKELGGAAQDWETPKKSAKEILQAALEDKTMLIKTKDKDGNEHIDEEQTELANQKIADLRERFESWLPSDPERVDMLEQTYNDRFNRTVIRHFDGSHLVVPGLMGKELRPHQKDAVWMLINNRGGIVDHIVGAGKTLVMQSAIMEMRRMGIAKKPMIVALKSTVSQIAREFKEAFPSARVLAPNDSDFKKENRKKFIANISLNDYDCIILSHEQYCMLPHTEEAEKAVINEQLWQLNNMIEYLYGTNDKSQMTNKQIKALEKRRNNLTATLEKRLDRNVDREFCFENLGVDYLFVDESHQFKSLPYVTSYQKVAGLGDPKGSSRAVALLTGIRHLQRMHQGDKGTVFLSGTTITNSLVEMYNLLNYLRPRKLEELGMPTFDAWASTFAVHSAELEAGVTGNFTMKDRFRNFDNITELSQLYREIADVRDDSNLKLPKPGFDSRTHIVKASPVMQDINAEIVKMIENKDGSYFGISAKDPNKAPWGLHASTVSAKAAVSPRLVFHDANDEGGKVQAVCDNVAKIFRETEEIKGVQLIFCEMGVPGKGKEYDAYTDMVNRFVNDYGVPRSEIAYIQEATNDEKRKALFQRVRDGKVRILIGGTKNMGTGVNVQDRITDAHMVTVPWTPSALAQCLGRAGRQGNIVARDFMGNKVRVHYYATEGSLDLYKYQLLDAKGKMISQFKSGTVGRSFDEGSMDEDGNMDPAEMVAILSGNPVIFERAKQEKVVKKLRALRNGFERDYQRKKAKQTELHAREERLERLVRLNERDRADLAREGFKPDDKGVYPTKFTIMEGYSRYGGRTFDKPKEAGEYLLKMLEEGKDVTLQGFGRRAKVVTVNEEGAGGLFTSYRVLQIGDGERDIKYTVRLSDDPTAAGTAFRNLLKRIIDNGEVYKRDLDETKRQLSGMNIGDGIFPRQAELDEAVAKFKELNAEYNKLGKTSEKPDAVKGKTRYMDPSSDRIEEITGEETSAELKAQKALELSERLGLPLNLNRTEEDLITLPSGRHRRAWGFYSRKDELEGRPGVTINLPNLRTVRDVVKAVFHEGVWHKGIRLFCKTEQERDRLMDHLYDNSSEEIRGEIDALEAEMFERAKDSLSRNERFLRDQAKPGERIYAGSPLAIALAHAEAAQRRERGEYRRDATEEFGARVQEEVEERGYEKMRADKLSFWKRVVNFMEKAMGAILRGIKIRTPWKYTRKEYQAMGSLFESKLREQAPEGPLREAEQIVGRYSKEQKAEKNEKVRREEKWKETARVLTDTKKPTQKETYSAPKDSRLSHQKDAALDSQSKSDVAKLKNICESLKLLERNVPDKGLGKSQIVYEIASALGYKRASSSGSNYEVVSIPGAGRTTIRISNHSAEITNFGKTGNNIGIVIKTSGHRFSHNLDIDYVELMYYGDKVSGNAALQREIVSGLRHYIETGSFERMPEPDRLNTSGAYRDALQGLEEAEARLEEYTEKMKAELAEKEAKYADIDATVEAAEDVAFVEDEEEEEEVKKETKPLFRFAESTEDFDKIREQAVAEKGIVTPDLAGTEVRVVALDRHDFTGARPINQAKEWAKNNLVGPHTLTDSDGKEIEYEISKRTVDKYLSASAIEKSDNLGVHLSVLKGLPEVIGESVEAEVHPDYLKGNDGKRRPENGYNPDTLVHRFYGAVRIGGSMYRVKTTVKETRENKLAPVPHSYEVTEIELLPEGNSSEMEPTVSPQKAEVPHGITKLLNNVEKSYDPGVKLLVAVNKPDPNTMEGAVALLSEKLHSPIRLISRKEAEAEGYRRKKGWYDRETGQITVVTDNHRNVGDIADTALHETVGHYGLRQLFGTEEKLNNFLDEAYNISNDKIKAEIDRRTTMMINDKISRILEMKRKEREARGENAESKYWEDLSDAKIEAEKQREQIRRDATEEYASDLGMKIGEEGFERMDVEEQTFWGKLKGLLQKALDRLLAGLKLPKMRRWTDKEWSYVLWKSWRNLRETLAEARDGNKNPYRGPSAEAEDIVKRENSNFGASESRLFRDPDLGLEEAITKMKADAAAANGADFKAKQDAMRAIGGNLSKLRQAMTRQREYDITTVKSMTDLGKILLDGGFLDDLSTYETKRILTAIKDAVGREDTSKQVQRLMDIMVDNQLRMGANYFGKLLNVKGSRVDARGIEVQGELDPDGQKIAQVVKKSTTRTLDDIDNMMAEAMNRMNSTDKAVADEAALEYAGLQIARQYVEDIRESKNEARDLAASIKEAQEEYKQGNMTHKAYLQYKAATEDAIRQNKIDRAEAYRSLSEQLGGVLGESVSRAKAWREEQKARVEEIHHNANSDMKGRPARLYKEDETKDDLLNIAANTLLSPLRTFEQMLKMFGSNSSRGEGYLYQRFMRQLMDALDNEWRGYSEAIAQLDEKVSQVFGEKMKWTDLYKIEKKLPKGKVKVWDDGEYVDIELKQGNLVYIYMVDKMTDGRMKLRRMGITEEDVERIKDFVDPRFIELADWIQEEFLVNKRNKYNEVYKRMYGTSMAAIENYFPIRVLKTALENKPEKEKHGGQTTVSAETTGAWKKRTRNNKPLDIMNANVISIMVEHLKEMEHAHSFSELSRDLNTLRKYKKFETRVRNMRSVYGAGKKLWDHFEECCSMATGDYRPPTSEFDRASMGFAKWHTAAQIAFRFFTAYKQFASFPAFLSDCRLDDFAFTGYNLKGSWKWAMENLPNFEKRWKSRIAGDPILKRMENERGGSWKAVKEGLGRWGMAANAFVDGLTVAIGARAMYKTKVRKYRRWGLPEEEVQKRAKQDAEILFNLSQQSSESAFLSTLQSSGTFWSAMWTVFRNASMSYSRQVYDACRNLGHRFKPGYKEQSIEFMRKQMERSGVAENIAEAEARREYRTGWARDVARVAIYAYVLPAMWYLFAKMPYLLLVKDDEKKEDMVKDALVHGTFGAVEGIVGGDLISDGLNMLVNGELNLNSLEKNMPIVEDIRSTFRHFKTDEIAALNDLINVGVQVGLGVNPQTLEDMVVAALDLVENGDWNDVREYTFLIARIMNCPQSQLDEIYFDEIGMSGEEIAEIPRDKIPGEIAERYAEYKLRRNAPLTGWAYSEEGREKALDKQRKKAERKMKERLNGRLATERTRELLEDFEEVSEKEKELNRLKKSDREAYLRGRKELRESTDMRRHNRVKRYNHDIKRLTEKWLNAKTPREADSIARTMVRAREKLLEDTGAAGSGHSTPAAGSGHSTQAAGSGHSTQAAG